MNKFFAMMVALLATVFATSAFAWDPPPSPAPASWISDPGHVLSADAHARLDAKLKVINQSSANEMAALILPSLNGESIEDAGDLTSKAWGVGKKNLDNGVLVVLAMKEHKSRISTGKGVEGDLPDLKANDILQAMRPYLRSGDVEGALGYAFDQSSKLIANHKAEAAAQAARGTSAPVPQPQASTRSGGCQVAAPGADTGVWPWVLALLGLGLFGWHLSRRSAARSRERLAQIEEETETLLRQQRERAERAQREAQMSIPTPVVEVPVVPSVSRPVAPSFPVAPVAAVAAVVAAEEAPRPHYTAPKKHHTSHSSSHSSSSSSSSSSDSSPSFSWGGGGSDSGGSGSFGGGDSGGGGSSSDW